MRAHGEDRTEKLMFLVRMLVGLLKGVIVGGAVGFGLVSLGMFLPTTVIAYGAAAVCGLLIALIAGKPIWASGARVEVGMKAIVGALMAPALLFALRRFVEIGLPADLLSSLPGLEALKGSSVSFSTFSVTSLAAVTAVISGFFDADNQPTAEDENAGAGKKRIASAGKRVSSTGAAEASDEGEAEKSRRARS